MSKFILSLFLIISPFFFFAQDPVKWKITFEPTTKGEGILVITGTIEPGWHTYSQKITGEGPVPTALKFTESKDFELIGTAEEVGAHEEFVKAFEANVFVFSGKAEFRQKVKLKSKKEISVKCELEFMSCNDMMCLPPKTVELSMTIPKAK